MTTLAATNEDHATKIGMPQRHCIEASLNLTFSHNRATSRTVLSDSRQEAPLKVVRAFNLEDGASLAHLHNVSGGILGGDRLMMSVHLEANAKVQLTTTGATRVYRPRDDASPATQQVAIAVGHDALLEYLPDSIIPYAGARYSQRTTVHLSQGAGLFYWEIVAPGREAHSEAFEYECVELKTDVVALDRPVASERIRLEPHKRPVFDVARLGLYRYWGTLYICRVGLDSKTWRAAEEHLRTHLEGLTIPGQLLIGVSTLTAHGLAVRVLARRGHQVLASLSSLWNVAKIFLYGCEAVPPRKVN